MNTLIVDEYSQNALKLRRREAFMRRMITSYRTWMSHTRALPHLVSGREQDGRRCLAKKNIDQHRLLVNRQGDHARRGV